MPNAPDAAAAVRRAFEQGAGVQGAGQERAGDRLGAYQLLEPIGEGGFGRVWLAERREPFVQRVAIKLIKAGMDSHAVVARFEQERQALAVMDHPNVARVFDGGVTPHGRPYFVMEYVRGEAITTYCDRQQLGIEDRLDLFAQVCDAVQHAHMKGIIHRDLKPSNILVAEAEGDGRPVPKVIDFGIAKAVSRPLTEKTIFTQTGLMLGTPEYMSPEQADVGTNDTDTRTDVYSLGVILYELLTGLLPFDPASLRSLGFAEVQRVIREVDPPKPSTRLSSAERVSASTIAKARDLEPRSLAARLRDELEWIPLKAMRKDRRERYGSVAALADDVRAYLRGDALQAGPESVAYRTRKFLRKYRLGVSLTAAALGVLAVALVGSLVALDRIKTERDLKAAATRKAELERDRSLAVTDFMVRTLTQSDPDRGLGNDVRVSAAMLTALEDMDRGGLKGRPEVECTLRIEIAGILNRIGYPERSMAAVESGLELARSVYGEKADIVARGLLTRGLLAIQQGDFARASLDLSESIEILRSTEARADHLIDSLIRAAALLLDYRRTGEARSLLDEAERLLPAVASQQPWQRLRFGFCKARALGQLGDPQAARSKLAETLRLSDDPTLDRTPFERAGSHGAAGFVFTELGDGADADRELQNAIELALQVFPDGHPFLAEMHLARAEALLLLGRSNDAVDAVRRAIEIGGHFYGPKTRRHAEDLRTLAMCLDLAGRLDEALATLIECSRLVDEVPDEAWKQRRKGVMQRDIDSLRSRGAKER